MSLSRENPVTENNDEQVIYQFTVKGILDKGWSDWFDGLTIKPFSKESTLIIGPIRDQAALHGLLNKIRDLGLTLLSVKRVDNQS